jgi:hypothetical protein
MSVSFPQRRRDADWNQASSRGGPLEFKKGLKTTRIFSTPKILTSTETIPGPTKLSKCFKHQKKEAYHAITTRV